MTTTEDTPLASSQSHHRLWRMHPITLLARKHIGASLLTKCVPSGSVRVRACMCCTWNACASIWHKSHVILTAVLWPNVELTMSDVVVGKVQR